MEVVVVCGVERERGRRAQGGYRRHRDEQEGREGHAREREREAASCGYEYDRGEGPSIRYARYQSGED